MNGRTIYGQTAIDRLANVYKSLPQDEREMFTVAQQAIQNGDTVEYNPTNNTIVVTNADGNDVTSTYTSTKANVNNSRFKKFWGAATNDEAHRFKKSGEAMALVDMSDESKKQEETPELTALRRGYGWFDYDKNDDDTLTYRENGIANQDRLAILDNIRSYMDLDDEGRKGYSTNGWLTKDLDAFTNSYKNVTDRDSYWAGLKERIKSNTLTDSDIEALTLFGFQKDSLSESGSHTEDSDKPVIDKDWTGDRQAAIDAGLSIRKKDGHWYISGNDDYTKSNWYNGGLNFLKGTDYENGFIINGRLYTEDEAMNPESESLRDTLAPFISAPRDNYRAWYDQVANSGIRFIGDRTGQDSSYYGAFATQYNPTTNYNSTWYNYFAPLGSDRTFDINDVTNYYAPVGGGSLGNRQIVSYVDPNAYRRTGVYLPKYAVYDPNNVENPYLTFNSEKDMLSKLGLVAGPYGQQRTFESQPWHNIKGKDYAVYSKFGKPGQENTILIDKSGKYYLALNDGETKPDAITDIALMQQILANPDNFNNKDIRNKLTKKTFGAALPRENGKLIKNQWGGTLNRAKTVSKVTDNFAERNVKTDVNKDHALDGTDGGLTNEEWLQIGAAVGDLAGVGLSFIPGAGNVAGAATGAAASTTRFVGDIKQDGFQGRDLGNYLINLGLDAATLILGLGVGAKAGKAVKTIKAFGKPIIKLLSIAGATTPVITAVTKIINGEKYTSEDLTQAIQGIGSAVIATKSIKDAIGNAKLAARTAAKAAPAQAEAIATTVKEASAGGFTFKRNNAQLKDFVDAHPTKASAIDEIKKIARDEKQLSLSDEDASKILTDIGVKFKNGKRSYYIFGKKGETTTSFETPKTEDAHSALFYYLSPRARGKVFGNEAVFGFGGNQGSVRNTVTAADIRRAKNMANPDLASQALLRMTAENPQAFGNMFRNANGSLVPVRYKDGIYFGGRRYYRNPSTKRHIALPASMRSYEITRFEDPILKNGGKIRKGLTGFGLPKIETPDVLKAEATTTSNFGLSKIETPKQKPGSVGGFTGKTPQINLANLDDILRAGVTANAINKDANIQHDALSKLRSRQFVAPQLSRANYDFSDIRQSYAEQRKPLLESRYVTSDPMASMAFKLAKAQSLSSLTSQENAEITQRKTAIDETNRNIENTNTVQRAAMANEQSQYLANLNYQDRMVDSAALNSKWSKVWNNLGNQFGQQSRDAQNKIADLNYTIAQQNAQDQYTRGINALPDIIALRNEYKASESTDSFEDWLALDASRMNRYNNAISNSNLSKVYQNALLEAQKTHNTVTGPRIIYSKKGGTIRSAQEQIAIDSAKAARTNYAKLSDNLMRMLQQLMK